MAKTTPNKSKTATISKATNGRITAWDAGAEEIFGYTAAEALGKHISIIIPFEYQDEEYELLDRLKDGEQVIRRATVRRTKTGTLLLVELSAEPVYDGNKKLVGVVKTMKMVNEVSASFIHDVFGVKIT